jgi:5-methyltetrahydrofolate--homocysteine methyltransferase
MSLESIYDAVLNGDNKKSAAETEAALKSGVKAEDILHKACIPAMAEVGRLFEEGEKFVPEMLISARAMQAAMALLRPELVKADVKTLGTVLIGTVRGDLHDIGKNLVKMMLEGAGFEVVDMGVDVSPQKFVDTAREKKAQIIGLSALLTTTMPAMKTTVLAVKEAKLTQTRVVIGGAPITAAFAKEIGADGFAPDAASAVEVVRQLVSAGVA